MMNFNKIISLCEKRGFLHKTIHPTVHVETFRLGPVGALLQENLRTEWFNSIVINKDIQVFPSQNGLSDTYNFAKEASLNILPFGVTQVAQKKRLWEEQFKMQEHDGVDFLSYFEHDEIFRCWVFLNPSNAVQFFHQWQRERRMWWRKFSTSPARYVLTDIKNGDGNSQRVDILAKYPWGEQLVESLGLVNEVDGVTSSQLQIKDGKKLVQAQCVFSKIYSSVMLLNTLCDAYDEPIFQDNPRPLLRLHRKLAPYKISFSVPSGSKSLVDELKDLALYICRQLRKNHVSCLLLPSSYKSTLDSQWRQYDQTGIPYNVLLNENTLKTGIAQLRSRDTTLKEQVHVTDLPDYVEKLFKNY
ncbi:DNA polymerase subunit gamma-2, mitochondrial [Zophobas morio]|uniref:DNA polymerase subunit gamma-2, mitochondrial n=1 Tax=Zophobas morio TaxID=2755281 RepID=UPI003083B0E8